MESTVLSDKAKPQPSYPRAKLLPEHTAFIINFVDKYPICKWTAILKYFVSYSLVLSISSSAVNKHMKSYCVLSLRRTQPTIPSYISWARIGTWSKARQCPFISGCIPFIKSSFLKSSNNVLFLRYKYQPHDEAFSFSCALKLSE